MFGAGKAAKAAKAVTGLENFLQTSGFNLAWEHVDKYIEISDGVRITSPAHVSGGTSIPAYFVTLYVLRNSWVAAYDTANKELVGTRQLGPVKGMSYMDVTMAATMWAKHYIK